VVSAEPEPERLGNGMIRIRVNATHGMPRAGYIGGQVVWFGQKETDHTVSPADLDELRKDPILRIHDLSNGFSEDDRRAAEREVEIAEEMLAAAKAKRDRVCAGVGKLRQVHVPALFEGGEFASIAPTPDMIHPADVLPPPAPAEGTPLAYLVPNGE
jgi:hypothetical protein